MKRQNFLYFALGAAIALPACQSDDAPTRMQGGVPVSDDVISIHSGISSIEEGSFTQGQGPASASRADDYNDEKYGKWVGEFTNNSGRNVLERFVCYAFHGNDFYMQNVLVSRNPANNVCTRTDDTWYWPMSEPLNFYAFAPYNYKVGDTYNNPNPESQQSDYHITVENSTIKLKDFEVNNPPVADVIYAQARDQYRWTNSGTVNLLFQHANTATWPSTAPISWPCVIRAHSTSPTPAPPPTPAAAAVGQTLTTASNASTPRGWAPATLSRLMMNIKTCTTPSPTTTSGTLR